MDMNNIGKFQMREIVNEFDSTLIRLYGVNMLDAAINRLEALIAYDEFHCPRKAAEVYGVRHGPRRPLQIPPSVARSNSPSRK